MSEVERKFQVILREWDHIETLIRVQGDAKFKIKGWAITVFSGVFALSIHQSNSKLLLTAIATTILFWILDSSQQTPQYVFYTRERELEKFFDDLSDEKIKEFQSPMIARKLDNEELVKKYNMRSYTHRQKVLFYGSMVLFIFIAFFIF